MSEQTVILAVDDTTQSLKLLGTILSRAGYRSRLADSGELALESLNSSTPDLILLDINMPGMDGFEVCRRLKANPCTVHIPVIFISAENESAKQVEGFHYGAIDFITKPFEAEILLTRIRTHLELSRLNREALERVVELEQAQKQLQIEMNSRREMQAQMFQQEKMASIGQMAAGVAHEINNPIGFITSNLSTLEKYLARITEYCAVSDQAFEESECAGKDEVMAARTRLKIDYITSDAHQLIAESLDGAVRVKNIVDDLKSLARTDKREMEHADLNKILESALNIACNEIKYVAEIERQLGEISPVLCHPQQLSQVFINLLTNAGQAIKGHGTISIRTWNDANWVNASVADSGSGIPEEIRQRIFEPFFTTKDVGKGTGLGLSISYDIIQKHDGEITVESTVGTGTTFIVRLPVCHLNS